MDQGDLLSLLLSLVIGILLSLLITYLWDRRREKKRVEQVTELLAAIEETIQPNDVKWAKQFVKIRKKTDKIVWGVHNAMLSGSLKKQLKALDKAIKKLPKPLQELAALPQLDSAKAQQSFNYYIQGLSTYLTACQHAKIGLERNDAKSIDEGTKQFALANELMDKSFFLNYQDLDKR